MKVEFPEYVIYIIFTDTIFPRILHCNSYILYVVLFGLALNMYARFQSYLGVQGLKLYLMFWEKFCLALCNKLHQIQKLPYIHLALKNVFMAQTYFEHEKITTYFHIHIQIYM